MRKRLLTSIICCLFLVPGILWAVKADCATVELKMSHFMPTKHTQHKVMAAWAKKMEQVTNGKLKVTIFPGGALGKPPQQYDNAVKGITDIAFGLHSYTAGRFPLTSVLRLPFFVKSGEQGSRVLWKLYEKYLKSEFKDAKILWMFCHGPGQIHTTKKPIKTLEDLKGVKMRTPGAVMSKVLRQLGAVPVTMPITQVYTALERRTVDGVCGPWEVMRPFKFYEKIKYSTVADIYTQTFFVAMNKGKYESLPADIKKAIDANTGEQMSITAGKAYDAADKPAYELCVKKGIKIYELPKQERERWIKAASGVADAWVKDMAAKGLPGREILDYTEKQLGQTK